MTTVQDYPGRIGYWSVGVPPSGPMDSLSFRIGNPAAGQRRRRAGSRNARSPARRLRFNLRHGHRRHRRGFRAALERPACAARRSDSRASRVACLSWQSAQAPGLAPTSCFAAASMFRLYLGSASTFILGRFGGHAGRRIAAGDVLHVATNAPPFPAAADRASASITNDWEIGVTLRPARRARFLHPRRHRDVLLHRLEGPLQLRPHRRPPDRPQAQWARRDGGEAGLHPSNIHDNAYAIGAIDFTGDMPVILGPDGPSLGGFVCPAVIVDAELWKIGQLQPGRFGHVS